jgi:hypothetical protein
MNNKINLFNLHSYQSQSPTSICLFLKLNSDSFKQTTCYFSFWLYAVYDYMFLVNLTYGF